MHAHTYTNFEVTFSPDRGLKKQPLRQQYILSRGDGKAGPQFVFLFALDCNVAFPADSGRPRLSLCRVFVFLFVVTDETYRAFPTEEPQVM